MNTAIVALIYQLAILNGVEPKVALAVAETESGFNPNMVGSAGEIGIFQIMPENIPVVYKKKLYEPGVNIAIGISLLAEAKKSCIHQKDYTWLTCYNLGPSRARKVRHPSLWPYVKHVKEVMVKY